MATAWAGTKAPPAVDSRPGRNIGRSPLRLSGETVLYWNGGRGHQLLLHGTAAVAVGYCIYEWMYAHLTRITTEAIKISALPSGHLYFPNAVASIRYEHYPPFSFLLRRSSMTDTATTIPSAVNDHNREPRALTSAARLIGRAASKEHGSWFNALHSNIDRSNRKTYGGYPI